MHIKSEIWIPRMKNAGVPEWQLGCLVSEIEVPTNLRKILTALGEGPRLVGAFSGHCETSRMFVGTSIDVPLHFTSCFAARCRPPQWSWWPRAGSLQCEIYCSLVIIRHLHYPRCQVNFAIWTCYYAIMITLIFSGQAVSSEVSAPHDSLLWNCEKKSWRFIHCSSFSF